MKRPTVMFALGALLGGAVIYFVYVRFWKDDILMRASTVVAEAYSPDGQYLARAERKSYGGDRCEVRTTISRDGRNADWSTDTIFDISCGGAMDLEWIGERELFIKFSYDEKGEVRISTGLTSKDGQVKISHFLEQ